MKLKLEDVCERGSSSLKQSDILGMTGDYPIYGASGYIGNVDFYHQEKPYVAIVKDGAGIGRTTFHTAKSSVIGTMQYLLPKDNVLPKYLYYVVGHMHLEKYFSGATIPHIYFKDYKSEEFNYDSLDKQKNIVEILGRCEKVISARKRELELLDSLIKARFVEMFGDPASNEKHWLVKDLETVTTIVTYGLTVRPEYIDDGVDLVSARELHKGFVAYEEAPKISEEDFEKLSDKGKPQINDILFSKTGSIGHCALVKDEKSFAITQNAARIGLKTELVNPLWLLYYLRMDYIQDWCKGHAKGNAVKDFQLQDMKVIPIFDCSIELQNQFAAFVNQVDKSKVVVQKALDETQLLFDSLMQKYFG